MKKLIFFLSMFIPSLAYAIGGDQTITTNPKILLRLNNTWTGTQTFKDIIITGTCTGCGGSSGGGYPDWKVDGTFTGVNAKGDNPLKFKSLQIDGDVYVLNSYTEHE